MNKTKRFRMHDKKSKTKSREHFYHQVLSTIYSLNKRNVIFTDICIYFFSLSLNWTCFPIHLPKHIVHIVVLVGSGNWNYAINNCLLREKTLLKDLEKYKNGWLDYFMYGGGMSLICTTSPQTTQLLYAIIKLNPTLPIWYEMKM